MIVAVPFTVKSPVVVTEPVTFKSPVIEVLLIEKSSIAIELAETWLNVTFDVVATSCPIEIVWSKREPPVYSAPSLVKVTPVPCEKVKGNVSVIPKFSGAVPAPTEVVDESTTSSKNWPAFPIAGVILVSTSTPKITFFGVKNV